MGATIYGLSPYPLPELLVNPHSLPQIPSSVYNPIREFISPSSELPHILHLLLVLYISPHVVIICLLCFSHSATYSL